MWAPRAQWSSTECQVDDQTVWCALKPLRKSTVKCFEHENTLYTPSSGPQGRRLCECKFKLPYVVIVCCTAMNHIIFTTVWINHKRIVKLSVERLKPLAHVILLDQSMPNQHEAFLPVSTTKMRIPRNQDDYRRSLPVIIAPFVKVEEGYSQYIRCVIALQVSLSRDGLLVSKQSPNSNMGKFLGPEATAQWKKYSLLIHSTTDGDPLWKIRIFQQKWWI